MEEKVHQGMLLEIILSMIFIPIIVQCTLLQVLERDLFEKVYEKVVGA